MDQTVEVGLSGYRHVCSTCLSSDRNLISINALSEDIHQIFRLLMYDFAGDRFGDLFTDIEHLLCWECVALMKRLFKFKRQVHIAQEHLRVLASSRPHESVDHTYLSQSLSPLEAVIKADYDRIFVDYSTREVMWILPDHTRENVKDEDFDVAQVVRDKIDLDGIDGEILTVPVFESLEDPSSQILVHTHTTSQPSLLMSQPVKGEIISTFSDLIDEKIDSVIIQPTRIEPEEKPNMKSGFTTEYMNEQDMLAFREEMKVKLLSASSAYKCELCIIGFHSQQQVEEHFVAAHRPKPGFQACNVCYMYMDETSLPLHIQEHYMRYTCRLCGYRTGSQRLQVLHVKTHAVTKEPGAINIVDLDRRSQRRKKKQKESTPSAPPKPGELRKLLSKTTIEGYKCLECDMFFKNSRARKNHVARFHREGLQCDHCKKRFVNRTTLATHLRLHEGPLPREECPICQKMVRVIQLKYHIQRHQNKSRYECRDCNKIFSHLATYQAHLKYSRAHASDEVFKFPCPMCNKGYPTKEQMQDHFNYQHLGKTSHKCPICEKPIASRANVEKHMMRVHGEKKQKPRNHACVQCGKTFTDKKALTQHEVIHSGDRPLSCDICQQTFKQKASLYTHRKRVHKVFPPKKVVEFMDKPGTTA